MPKKKPLKGAPEVNEALKGFDIRIDEFGEIMSNFEVDRLNKFLDETVPDKKLLERQGKEAKKARKSKEKAKRRG